MKGYGIVLLVLAIILLLLPLPALPAEPTATATTSTPPESQSPADEEPSNNADNPPSGTGLFRLLVGDTVVELEEREFLIRTLAFEMSPTYHAEALKAQAVAAYTYYGRRRELQKSDPDPELKGADFATPDATFPGNYTTTALKAKWGDAYDANYNKICQAVDAVMGKTITYEGALIDACYFAISGGSTESAAVLWGAEVPYLQPVASPGDVLCPDYESRVTFSTEELKEKLSTAHDALTWGDDPATWLGTLTRSEAGTVTGVPIGGTTLTGAQVRTALGLRSACFDVTYENNAFAFLVRGYGHGVGMSQYGADYLARQGYTYEEILCHYYTNVTVS